MHLSYIVYLMTLVVSLVSILTAGLVVKSYFNFQSSNKTTSRQLQIIVSLICADGAVGSGLILWSQLNRLVDDATLEVLCRAALPIPVLFINAGYGFMVPAIPSNLAGA